MQRHGQIRSWTPGAVWTKKRKGNFSKQAQEQWLKSPQSTWCTLNLWNTWIDNESSQNWGSGPWEQRYVYFFSFFSFSECVFVCLFVWFCLYSFDFTIWPRVLSFFCFVVVFFSIVCSTCYHWWICFLVWLLSSFFLSFLIYFFIFNNIFFILITLF